jgi:hypothetical protein
MPAPTSCPFSLGDSRVKAGSTILSSRYYELFTTAHFYNHLKKAFTAAKHNRCCNIAIALIDRDWPILNECKPDFNNLTPVALPRSVLISAEAPDRQTRFPSRSGVLQLSDSSSNRPTRHRETRQEKTTSGEPVVARYDE